MNQGEREEYVKAELRHAIKSRNIVKVRTTHHRHPPPATATTTTAATWYTHTPRTQA